MNDEYEENRLNLEYIDKLKNEYEAIIDHREAFGFILALRTMNIANEQILYITE